MGEKYTHDENTILMNTKDGVEQLSNFTAQIVKELIYHDGGKKKTILEIEGTLFDGTPLPSIRVVATEMQSMSWVAEQWGSNPIIFPVSSGERHLKTAIQLNSRPTTTHIYTHTGWANVNGQKMYLSAAGGIHADGHDPELNVQLPTELQRYSLPAPSQSKDAFAASLKLVRIGPTEITWPLILAAYRAAIGGSDFAMHVAGRTGTYKSELVSLIQSHFGSEMDARHLPGSWSSTANANEHLAYRAKDAIIVIDDYVPTGTSWHVKALTKAADQLIRGQGNQSGRARLTEISQMQETFYPRGIILSTGEDVPEGHSVRGRMMIAEVKPGDIDTKKLTEAQGNRTYYPQAMADWIQWLAQEDRAATLKNYSSSIRNDNLEVGHTRTPSMIGDLIGTLFLLMEYAVERGFLSAAQAAKIQLSGGEAVIKLAEGQAEYLTSADPTNVFAETIANILDTNRGHLKTRNGGAPEKASLMGWEVERVSGHAPSYHPQGSRLGWVDFDNEELLIDPTAVEFIKKSSGDRLPMTAQTLIKQLRDAGMLKRTDAQRQRNTVRVTCEGSNRQCLVLNLRMILDGRDANAEDVPT